MSEILTRKSRNRLEGYDYLQSKVLRTGRDLSLLFLVLFSNISFGAEDMVINLPKPNEKGKLTLEETIKKRRSERNLSGKELSQSQIGQLLWACQGVSDEGRGFRSAPSAGATYPLEIYLVAPEGFFQYIPRTHSLKRLKTQDLREELSIACMGQNFVKSASIDIIICADFKRTTARYGKRGESYVYIETGHAAQNVHLQAVSLGLGSVPVGAFSDDDVKELLTLPEELIPIYVIPVGQVK